MSRLLHGPFALAFASALLFTTACSDSPGAPAVATDVEIVSGEDQIGPAGAQLPDPIVVVVLDADGRPVANHPVTFTVVGGGSLQDASTRTDASGLAQVRWTLGTSLDTEQRIDVKAVSSGSSGTTLASTSVFATVAPAAAASLVIISPNPQITWEGGNVIAPSVRVVDAYGNPIPGVPVTFAVTSGGGSLTNATVTSGPQGIATVGGWRLGAVGANSVVASSGTLAPVTFTATARSLTPASVTLSAGQDQVAGVTMNVPIAPSVIVRNAAGDALPGITVTFTPGPNSGNVTPTTVTTNLNGVATVGGWFLGTTAGQQTLVAAASPTATFTFRAQATPGSPRTLEKSAGDAQIAAPGATLPIAPAVTVRDAYGNVVPNVTVTFAVYNGNGSVTGATAVSNAAGVATVGSWTLGPISGTQTLRASTPQANDADFTAQARTGIASLISAHPQNPTSAVPGREITLAVIVRDDIGEPLGGVAVDFAPSPSQIAPGTVLPPSRVTSDAQGVASVRFVMPGTVHMNTHVDVSGTGMQTLRLTVSPLLGPPKEIRVTMGTGSTAPGGELGRPEVVVVDSNGTALPMISVNFKVTGGGGTVDGAGETTMMTATPPSTTTGPLWRAGPVAGENTLVISTPGEPGVPSVVLTRTTSTP